MKKPVNQADRVFASLGQPAQSLGASRVSWEQSSTLPMWQDCLARRQRTRKRHKDSYRLMIQHRTPSPLIYHQELAILSRFFNDVDRFIHAATFGEGDASPTHGSLWPYCERCSSGRSKGGPWGSQGFRLTSQCRERQQSASCASFKSAGSFHATGAGSSFLWIVLISLAWWIRWNG
jgi:hypothetical protein